MCVCGTNCVQNQVHTDAFEMIFQRQTFCTFVRSYFHSNSPFSAVSSFHVIVLNEFASNSNQNQNQNDG